MSASCWAPALILSSAMSLYYAPVMLVLGLVMGALTSVTLRAILPALGRLGYNTREKRAERLRLQAPVFRYNRMSTI